MIQRAIVINCLPRSGSNILWNIIGSSPDVAMTKAEFHAATNHNHQLPIKILKRINALCPPLPLTHNYIRKSIKSSQEQALQNDTQRLTERSISPQNMSYTCFKVMGGDNRFNNLIAASLSETKFIYLTRSAEGLCDSYYRRNESATEAARTYAIAIRNMQKHFENNPNGLCIRFEDLTANLSDTVDLIYKHLDIKKPKDNKYLLKQKSYGPGNEQSSKQEHTKKLNTLSDIQKGFKTKTSETYRSTIPDNYWHEFSEQVQQILPQAA